MVTSTDASSFPIGEVLQQMDDNGLLRPVAFFGKPLQGTAYKNEDGKSVVTGQHN